MLDRPLDDVAVPADVADTTVDAGGPVPGPSAPPTEAAGAGSAPVPILLGHPALRLWAGAAAFAALLVAVWALLVFTETGQRIENLALAGAALRTEPARTDSATGLGLISETTFALVIVLAAAAAVLRRRLALMLVLVLAMGGSVVIAELLKESLSRPAFVDGPTWILRNTFPSGHAAVAAAVGVGIMLAAPARLRWLALPTAAALAAVAGWAIIAAGWHRASDVVGSVLLVLAVTSAVLAVLAALGHVAPETRGQVHPRIRRGLVALALITLGVGAVLAAAAIVVALVGSKVEAYAGPVHLALGFAAAGLTILAFDAFGRLVEPLAFGRRETKARPEEAGGQAS